MSDSIIKRTVEETVALDPFGEHGIAFTRIYGTEVFVDIVKSVCMTDLSTWYVSIA